MSVAACWRLSWASPHRFMRDWLRDARVALRTFRHAPGFAAAAVLSIGIGVGANTAIFSVTNALLVRPLPYPDPGRLAILWNRSPGLNITEDWFSTAQYFDIKTRHSGLADAGIAIGSYMTLSGDGPEPERIGVIRLSSNLLTMMGATTERGRVLGASDDVPGSPNVALLHYGTWIRRYGGDPNVVGRTIQLNGQPFEIAGVLSRAFSLPREVLPTLGVVEDADIVVPLRLNAQAATARDHEDYNIVARLKPGVTFAVAQQEMDRLTASLRAEYPHLYPPTGGLTFSLVPIQDQVAGGLRRPLWILSAAVLAVLLIACVNVANLLLSRSAGAAARTRGTSGIGRRTWTIDSTTPDRKRVARRRRWRGGNRARLGRSRMVARAPSGRRADGGHNRGRCSRVDVHARADACRRRAVWPGACAEFVARRSGACAG